MFARFLPVPLNPYSEATILFLGLCSALCPLGGPSPRDSSWLRMRPQPNLKLFWTIRSSLRGRHCLGDYNIIMPTHWGELSVHDLWWMHSIWTILAERYHDYEVWKLCDVYTIDRSSGKAIKQQNKELKLAIVINFHSLRSGRQSECVCLPSCCRTSRLAFVILHGFIL